MGALQDRLVPGPPDHERQSDAGHGGVGPYLNAGSARGARRAQFLSRFAAGVGQHACGLPEPGRASLAVRVAGYWGTVLQQSVRSGCAAQL